MHRFSIALVLILVPFAVHAGDGATQITFDAAYDCEPCWSPDGSQIAFQSDRSGYEEIWVIPSDGGTATQLTFGLYDGGPFLDPDWSPDGSQIAFSWDHTIWVIPSEGGAATSIIGAYGASDPSWSPDGSQIAFQHVVGGWVEHSNIFAISSDGGTLTQITFHPLSWDQDPSWSPDGSQIAYSNHSNGGIWVIPSNGGAATWITHGYSPDWSPDGSQIVFEDSANIQMIPISGGTATQLTSDPAADWTPAWSPDGSQIAFASNRSGNFDIWVITLPPVSVDQESWGSIKDKFRE